MSISAWRGAPPRESNTREAKVVRRSKKEREETRRWDFSRLGWSGNVKRGFSLVFKMVEIWGGWEGNDAGGFKDSHGNLGPFSAFVMTRVVY